MLRTTQTQGTIGTPHSLLGQPLYDQRELKIPFQGRGYRVSLGAALVGVVLRVHKVHVQTDRYLYLVSRVEVAVLAPVEQQAG